MLSEFDSRRSGGIPNDYVDFRHGVAHFPIENFPNIGSINYGGPWTDGPLALKGDLSIEMKIRLFSYGEGCGSTSRLIYNGVFAFGLWGETQQYAWGTSDGVAFANSATGGIHVDEWTHLVYTRSGTDPYAANFYVNGYLSGEADQESGTELPTSDDDLVVVDPNFGWLGEMEFITLYNTVLSSEEAYNLYM